MENAWKKRKWNSWEQQSVLIIRWDCTVELLIGFKSHWENFYHLKSLTIFLATLRREISRLYLKASPIYIFFFWKEPVENLYKLSNKIDIISPIRYIAYLLNDARNSTSSFRNQKRVGFFKVPDGRIFFKYSWFIKIFNKL
jgi:hypothetical protein